MKQYEQILSSFPSTAATMTRTHSWFRRERKNMKFSRGFTQQWTTFPCEVMLKTKGNMSPPSQHIQVGLTQDATGLPPPEHPPHGLTWGPLGRVGSAGLSLWSLSCFSYAAMETNVSHHMQTQWPDSCIEISGAAYKLWEPVHHVNSHWWGKCVTREV